MNSAHTDSSSPTGDCDHSRPSPELLSRFSPTTPGLWRYTSSKSNSPPTIAAMQATTTIPSEGRHGFALTSGPASGSWVSGACPVICCGGVRVRLSDTAETRMAFSHDALSRGRYRAGRCFRSASSVRRNSPAAAPRSPADCRASVAKPQPVGVQRLARQQRLVLRPLRQRRQVRQPHGVAAAIDLVGQHRTADAGQVDADLVRPPRARLDAAKREAAETLDHFIITARVPRVLVLGRPRSSS